MFSKAILLDFVKKKPEEKASLFFASDFQDLPTISKNFSSQEHNVSLSTVLDTTDMDESQSDPFVTPMPPVTA
jgi:hypothetical protein